MNLIEYHGKVIKLGNEIGMCINNNLHILKYISSINNILIYMYSGEIITIEHNNIILMNQPILIRSRIIPMNYSS